MARKRKVHKGLRNQRDNARSAEMPNLARASGKLTDAQLRAILQQSKQAGTKGASAKTNRERDQRRHREEW